MKKNRIPVIGITGGAGGGKSHIAALLGQICNVYHINTDRISETQMKKNGCVYKKVLEHFGDSFLQEDGEINRKKLGEYVFERPDELAVLNSITHPPVKEEVKRRIAEADENGYDIILLESALLIEAGYRTVCTEVWYVYASRETRKKRLMETRGYSKERIESMLRRQKTDKYFRKNADYVVKNDKRDDKDICVALKRRVQRVLDNLQK